MCVAHGFVQCCFHGVVLDLETVYLNPVQMEEGNRHARFSLLSLDLFAPWVTFRGTAVSTKPVLCSPEGMYLLLLTLGERLRNSHHPELQMVPW